MSKLNSFNECEDSDFTSNISADYKEQRGMSNRKNPLVFELKEEPMVRKF